MDALFKIRYKLNNMAYKYLAKPLFFQFDPELMHKLFTKIGFFLGSNILTKKMVKAIYDYQSPILEQNLLGIKFKNPIGLAAGFDKNANLANIMEDVGFGFVEIGSITAQPCSGNSGTRLKRLPEKKAIWVNMGLNNDGAEAISQRLKKIKLNIPIGISIARTNCKETANENIAIKDQEKAFSILKDLGNYLTLNISCPNAFGGQPFTNPKRFQKLMRNLSKQKISKPLFIKLSPDISDSDLKQIVSISKKYKVSGFICSNLTKLRDTKSGGYSGKIVEEKSDILLKRVYSLTKGKSIIIGVGGIFTAQDVYKKIKFGANLVQLATGLIFKGPALIGELNYELSSLLKRDGFSTITNAIGIEYKKRL